MRDNPRLHTFIVLLCLLPAALVIAQTAKKRAKRAKLPTFDAAAKDVFFDDVFAKLEGDRPDNLSANVVAAAGGGAPGGGDAAAATYAWSKIVSPTTLEDEVKAIKLATDKNVTTPTAFAGTGHKEVRRDFSILAAVFAVISEYDGDVRWKKDSPIARDVFARTASNTKAGGNPTVYKEVNLRKADLQDLIGGSSLAANGEVSPETDWANIADISPVMQRLELGANEHLSSYTSDKDTFESNIEKVLHEAEMIALLAEVMTKDGMELADDDDYKALALGLKSSALEVVAAVKLNNADAASAAASKIGQACDACHENYR